MIKMKCIICGNSVDIYPYRAKTFRFCSKRCFSKGAKRFQKGYTPWNKGKFGKDMPRWKNGISKNLRGYIEIHQPSHPFCNYKKHILEHRLIMEKELGRYLTKKEIVHHINGIKDDNRIENLQLFADDIKHRKFHRELLSLS